MRLNNFPVGGNSTCANPEHKTCAERRGSLQKELEEFTSKMLKKNIRRFTLKFKDKEMERKVVI